MDVHLASRIDFIFWNYFIVNFTLIFPVLDVLVKPLGLLCSENCWLSQEGPIPVWEDSQDGPEERTRNAQSLHF